jgi:hypothetical protein
MLISSTEAMQRKQRQQEQPMMAGGYSIVDDLRAPSVNSAAIFAVEKLNEATKTYSFASSMPSGDPTVKVVKAYRQVVAGMNYKLVVLIEDSPGQYVGSFAATVWDQFGALSVTNWGQELTEEEVNLLRKGQEVKDVNFG